MLAHESGHTDVIVPVNPDDVGRSALNSAVDRGNKQHGDGGLASSERGPDRTRDPRNGGLSERWSNQDRGGTRSVPVPIWLGLVVVLALGVRLWGITWQLPYVLYYDE